MDTIDFLLKFCNNQLQFTLRHTIQLQPGEIRRIPLQFISTIQAVPELSTDFHPPVVIKPEISFSPDIQISEVHLANCSIDPTSIPQDTLLFQLDFLHPQLVGIQTDIAHILSTQALTQNITNFAFLEHISRAIQHLGTRSYIRDLTSYQHNNI